MALYNTIFEKHDFTPLPQWREPPESLTATPELAERYPLILSDYHTSKNFSASWQRNVPHLREIQPEPMLHIHPRTAATREIRDGDWVVVRSPHSWMKVKAEIYPGIRPDTVIVQFDDSESMQKCDLCRSQNLAGASPPVWTPVRGKRCHFWKSNHLRN